MTVSVFPVLYDLNSGVSISLMQKSSSCGRRVFVPMAKELLQWECAQSLSGHVAEV